MHRGPPERLDVRPCRPTGQAKPRPTWRTGSARVSAVLARVRVRMPGRAFAAITVAPALVAVAWLVPGTGLLVAGRLLTLPMMIIFVPLAVVLCDLATGGCR